MQMEREIEKHKEKIRSLETAIFQKIEEGPHKDNNSFHKCCGCRKESKI